MKDFLNAFMDILSPGVNLIISLVAFLFVAGLSLYGFLSYRYERPWTLLIGPGIVLFSLVLSLVRFFASNK